VNELFGIDTSDQTIYALVFLVEQLMATGGGWQDQVGGLTPGIKFFTSKPGHYQNIYVEYLSLDEQIKKELEERFVLIFSGQRRLARNILREQLNQCIRSDKEALETIGNIQDSCSVARQKLLKGDITSFAHYITKHFEMLKTLDKGTTNTCIEYIFDVCDDLIEGKSICGAGGGGFLMVILKPEVSKADLQARLEEKFAECGIEVWDSEFVW
jgi:fucokinase